MQMRRILRKWRSSALFGLIELALRSTFVLEEQNALVFKRVSIVFVAEGAEEGSFKNYFKY